MIEYIRKSRIETNFDRLQSQKYLEIKKIDSELRKLDSSVLQSRIMMGSSILISCKTDRNFNIGHINWIKEKKISQTIYMTPKGNKEVSIQNKWCLLISSKSLVRTINQFYQPY